MGAFKGKNAKWLTMLVAISTVIVLTVISYQKKQADDEIKKEEKTSIKTIDKVIMRDLEEEYPASVREVIKYYYKVLQCMFNGEVNDKEVIKLIDKERAMLDDELLKKNEYSKFLKGRNEEIKQYKRTDAKLLKFVIQDSDEVRYWQNNKAEMASIKAHIFMSGSKAYKDVYQEYVLRKDTEGRWKILSWENTSDDKEKENNTKEKK